MKHLALSALFLMSSVPAMAADHKWGLSFLGGLLQEEKHDNVVNHEGALGGVQLARRFGARLELSFAYTHAKVDYTSSVLPGVKVKYRDDFGALCAAFRFGGLLKGLYVGPQAAIVTRNLVKENDDVGLTSMGYGARLGYDIPLTSRFSVGAQANYLSVAKAERTLTSDNVRTTYTAGATKFRTLLMSLQYRFW